MGALKTKNASTEAARGLVREIVAKAHTQLPAMKATFVSDLSKRLFHEESKHEIYGLRKKKINSLTSE